eukprot:830596-Pelagomonas_calceolata.AAC.1
MHGPSLLSYTIARVHCTACICQPVNCQRFSSEEHCQPTWDRFLIPSTKQMASRMLDLPLPLRPVMALKLWSKLCKLTRCA